ncbi:MAG: RNA polymerase sporulation sigma factor SigK [Lachnospiraceae bacterium]|nr:RNA polymerase sporulation sigma factor SigK [Lachnospiraceae bacterium]
MPTFRKPLSQEEERRYLKEALQGDLEARNHLVVHNMRLVAHIVKKYHNYEKETEDLISVGTIGLIKAINTFKIESSNRLVTYASKCIENEILMMLRYKKKSAKDISIYEPIGSDKEGNEISLLDIIYEPETDFDETIFLKDNEKFLYKILNQMEDGREKYIIINRYGLYGKKEMTQREISEQLGISRSYVSRIEKKAIDYLRKKFEEEWKS